MGSPGFGYRIAGIVLSCVGSHNGISMDRRADISGPHRAVSFLRRSMLAAAAFTAHQFSREALTLQDLWRLRFATHTGPAFKRRTRQQTVLNCLFLLICFIGFSLLLGFLHATTSGELLAH